MAEKKRESPRLHIVHRQTSRIRHTDVGEYQVTVSLQVEVLNTEKEMVHVQFLVEGKPQRGWQLLGDDGWCEETLVLKSNTHLHLQVLLRWRHDPMPTPIDLGHVDVPAYIDPREQYALQGIAVRWFRQLDVKKQQGIKLRWWERFFG